MAVRDSKESGGPVLQVAPSVRAAFAVQVGVSSAEV
ncbi:hypothetical protein [Streptomyces sp. NBC_01261]